MLTLEYWYLFPTSILIATVAMASGVGGGVFFSPLFILVLKLEPSVAIATALITQLFGFSSAFVAYLYRKLIDFRVGKSLLLFSLPAAVVGSLSANSVPADALKALFAAGMSFIGWQLFRSYRRDIQDSDTQLTRLQSNKTEESVLVDRTGTEYRYSITCRGEGRFLAGLGGTLLGMISVGLAELQMYYLIGRCNIPSIVAVATSIFVVVITLFVASFGYLLQFSVSAERETLIQIAQIVAFTAPGVLIGGQLGPLIQACIDPNLAKVSIAFLVVLVGLLMLITLI